MPANQKGYDNSETIAGKLSTRRIQICKVYFSVIIFWPLSFKTSKNMAPTKTVRIDLNSPRRELSSDGLGIVVALLVRWQINFSCAPR